MHAVRSADTHFTGTHIHIHIHTHTRARAPEPPANAQAWLFGRGPAVPERGWPRKASGMGWQRAGTAAPRRAGGPGSRAESLRGKAREPATPTACQGEGPGAGGL